MHIHALTYTSIHISLSFSVYIYIYIVSIGVNPNFGFLLFCSQAHLPPIPACRHQWITHNTQSPSRPTPHSDQPPG